MDINTYHHLMVQTEHVYELLKNLDWFKAGYYLFPVVQTVEKELARMTCDCEGQFCDFSSKEMFQKIQTTLVQLKAFSSSKDRDLCMQKISYIRLTLDDYAFNKKYKKD